MCTVRLSCPGDEGFISESCASILSSLRQVFDFASGLILHDIMAVPPIVAYTVLTSLFW